MCLETDRRRSTATSVGFAVTTLFVEAENSNTTSMAGVRLGAREAA